MCWKTMILLILGTDSVCNFFLTNVNKSLVYKSIILVDFFSNTIVASVSFSF